MIAVHLAPRAQDSSQVPREKVQAGVYDCRWGTDTIRVVVAGELSREPHNAPLHLFSARPGFVEFCGRTYGRRSEDTSGLLVQLFEGFQAEGLAMPFTMEDFRGQFVMEHLPELSDEEQEKVLQRLPAEKRFAGLTEEEIRQYLGRLASADSLSKRKPRRKK